MGKIQTPGKYDVKAIEAEFGETENNRTPFLSIKFEDKNGDTISKYNWVTKNALEYTDKMLREIFGFDGQYNNAEAQIVGKEANIVIVIKEDDNGKEWPEVAWINKIGSSGGGIPIENRKTFLDSLTIQTGGTPEAMPANLAPTQSKADDLENSPF